MPYSFVLLSWDCVSNQCIRFIKRGILTLGFVGTLLPFIVHAQDINTNILERTIPVIAYLLDGDEESPPTGVVANISASRTECVSPCTVVFSAEKTAALGLNQDTVWTDLAFHWDFDTDETDTFGSLYQQNYTYVGGDTAYETGYVPLVSKTFFCATGECLYNVGLRAQNVDGHYGDTYINITVQAESTRWQASDTVCVSNTLNIASDWSGFDKGCPAGAVKQSLIPPGYQLGDKLVLLKRGDTFNGDIRPDMGQSNFKIGWFGDINDSRPEIVGEIDFNSVWNGVSYRGASDITNSVVTQKGWTENVTVEGVRLRMIDFPMSFQHIGFHDIDMDQESSTNPDIKAGLIRFENAAERCRGNADLNCANIPISKGAYISKTDIVGSSYQFLGINIMGLNCAMVNNLAVVDSRIRKTIEHNLRVMGWYRFSIMRNFFRGQHGAGNKQKITPRPCFDNTTKHGNWSQSGLQATWNNDVEGRPVADLIHARGVAHESRYLVTNGNVVGDSSASAQGAQPGGGKFQTNSNIADDYRLMKNIVVTNNIFVTDPGATVTGDIALDAIYSGCFLNTYSGNAVSCGGSSAPTLYDGFIRENEVRPYITIPLRPGT